MKLLKLSIERHTYGDKKGTFSGEATFTGETGKVTLHLNEHHIRANAIGVRRRDHRIRQALPPACLCKRRWRARKPQSSASLRPPPCKTLPHACRSPCHEPPHHHPPRSTARHDPMSPARYRRTVSMASIVDQQTATA